MTNIQKGHGVGQLVLGAIVSFCGLLIIILSAIMSGKANVGAVLGPWWVGLLVSVFIHIYPTIFLYIFQKRVKQQSLYILHTEKLKFYNCCFCFQTVRVVVIKDKDSIKTMLNFS